MSPRINYRESSPQVFRSMLALHTATRRSSLLVEPLDLIDYRVSLLTGAPFALICIQRTSEREVKRSSGST